MADIKILGMFSEIRLELFQMICFSSHFKTICLHMYCDINILRLSPRNLFGDSNQKKAEKKS